MCFLLSSLWRACNNCLPESDGVVKPGDVVLRVDSNSVGVNTSLEKLRDYIVGDEGSRVRLSFRRMEEGSPLEYEVLLTRGSANFLRSGAGERIAALEEEVAQGASKILSLERENDDLRSRLRETMGELASSRSSVSELQRSVAALEATQYSKAYKLTSESIAGMLRRCDAGLAAMEVEIVRFQAGGSSVQGRDREVSMVESPIRQIIT